MNGAVVIVVSCQWSLVVLNHTVIFVVCRGVYIYITDSVLVDLGISVLLCVRSSCAIGNNELVVTQN